MKKAILLSALAVAVSFTAITAKAQQGFYIGAKTVRQLSVMFNKTDVDDPNTDYKSSVRGAFGVTAGYHFTKNAGVGTDLLYYTAKQTYTNHGLGYTQEYTNLKVPVLFTYNGNPDKKFMFTAKAGPQLGINIKSKITGADNSELNGSTNDKYKKFTLGAMGGLGARMHLSNNLFLDAGLRFDGTFTNTENKNYAGYQSGRAKTYDLNAGLEFGIKYFFN